MSESQTYIGKRLCGCLVMAIVNNPEDKKDVAREVAKAIREGLSVYLVSSELVRTMPWKCETHKEVKKGVLQGVLP